MVHAVAAVSLSSSLVLSSLAGALGAQDVVRAGKTFEVTVHPGALAPELAARLAGDALAAVEAVRPLLDKLQVRPAHPVALHLYEDRNAFGSLPGADTPAAAAAGAFALADGSAAHVLMAPALPPATLEVLGLPPSSAHALVHAGALALARATSECARHDAWLAEVFAAGVLEASTNPKLAYGVDPGFDMRRERFAQLAQAGQAPRLQDLVAATALPKTDAELAQRAAATAAIAQCMAASGATWARKLLARPGKLQGLLPDRLTLVESVVGKDWARSEQRFGELLAAMRPRWSVDSPMAAVRGGQIVIAGTEPTAASMRLVPDVPAGPYAVRGTFRVAPLGMRQFRIQVDWDGTSLLGVFFQPGRVTLEQWQPDQPWKPLADGEAAIECDRAFTASVEIDDGLRVLVDGKQVLAATPSRGLHGGVSIAANDTVVLAEQLRVEPLAAKKK